MQSSRFFAILALALVVPTAAAQQNQESKPWRLERALGLPDWLTVSGTQRTRFETLENQFRTGSLDRDDHLWALRTTLLADVRYEGWMASAEFWDARQLEADDGSALNTTTVNAAELIQFYVGYEGEDVFGQGDSASLIVGRHTMDLGSRRLVARNRFRNTTNTFMGLNGLWTSADGDALQVFFTAPTQRLPNDKDSLLDNEVEFDREFEKILFWGVHGTLADVVGDADGELYYFGFDEQDTGGVLTADRAISTVGGRLIDEPSTGSVDYEVEAAWQFGDSRSGSSSTTDLDHEAYFLHLHGGYTFDAAWKPRAVLLFDYASGDDSPTDDENNRFTTLFGARRWEFGPTGIFGAISRDNVVTPGAQLHMFPSRDWRLGFGYRSVYLASDTDFWVPGGVIDPSGDSGNHVGELAEVMLQWKALPGNWTLEVGAAYLANGSFLDNAPNASGNGDTTYAYVMSTVSF